jgi:hypothetical protein
MLRMQEMVLAGFKFQKGNKTRKKENGSSARYHKSGLRARWRDNR